MARISLQRVPVSVMEVVITLSLKEAENLRLRLGCMPADFGAESVGTTEFWAELNRNILAAGGSRYERFS